MKDIVYCPYKHKDHPDPVEMYFQHTETVRYCAAWYQCPICGARSPVASVGTNGENSEKAYKLAMNIGDSQMLATCHDDLKTDDGTCVRKEWEEFRECGMLWFINTILHVFGWSIVVEIDENVITDAFPARVKFRGFPESKNSEGYVRISRYLKENAKKLLEEAET